MKKAYIIILMIVSLVIVTGCQSQAALLAEQTKVAKKVSETIDDEAALQLINDGSKGSYVVLRSTGDVEYNAFVRNKKAIIHFTVSNEDDEAEINEYIYYLKEDSAYDTIQVLVNEKEVAFNVVTGI